MYIYVSNEDAANVNVHFDDLKITHRKSKIVQMDDYYPFGLQHATSWTRSTTVKNNRLYNAGSEFNEQTKNYETFYRQYDPAIGRFTAIDIMAGKYTSITPYQYAFNDPIAFNDPLGDDPNSSSYVGAYEMMLRRANQYAGDGYLASRMQNSRSRIGSGSERANQYFDSYEDLRTKRASISMGGGLDGLTKAMISLNAAKMDYGAGTFTYGFAGKTYGGSYHTTNGMVTSTATNQLIQEISSGGWMHIGETTISDYSLDVHQGRYTLWDANYRYRNNLGDVTIDASIIDLSGVDPKIFSGINDKKTVNILWNSRDGLVHGKLDLIYRGNNKVRILSNDYDFDTGGTKHPWINSFDGFKRNIFTILGNIVAFPGTKYTIHFDGLGDLNYKPAPFVPQYSIGPKY